MLVKWPLARTRCIIHEMYYISQAYNYRCFLHVPFTPSNQASLLEISLKIILSNLLPHFQGINELISFTTINLKTWHIRLFLSLSYSAYLFKIPFRGIHFVPSSINLMYWIFRCVISQMISTFLLSQLVWPRKSLRYRPYEVTIPLGWASEGDRAPQFRQRILLFFRCFDGLAWLGAVSRNVSFKVNGIIND